MAADKMIRVSTRGRITLPKWLREKAGINAGDYLLVSKLSDNTLFISKPSSQNENVDGVTHTESEN
ncbi:MAG: AbrB/MazE/SpoVT family DNA-binding domain-containing protein [Armatimonadetes bacterium]|nr:AbrB/MazE/SpoVT family DNA-binding domain-containing protein [Armatimonadota bacterium]